MSTNSISVRARVQAYGGFLTNMVLPNIGAFIAWGIVTALFIPTGWIPNETFGQLVGPTIRYLLPLLLAHTGGRMIGGQRGGVMGTLGAVGLIIGSEIPMFLGAMIVGPLGGWIISKEERFLEDRIPVGFEMVVNNFSIGILGFLFMMLSFWGIGPIIEGANKFVSAAIGALVQTGFLLLLSIVNEPAKVLFLNNVIDQAIYYPLGLQQTVDEGQSIYFMVASNPGPGLGLLLAYSLWGDSISKRTAPGAIVIHFLGGIHELYFPYVLMKPITIISMILGGMTGILTFQIFGVGLVGGPSPGSIFSYLALTPKGNFLGVIAGVLSATLVSFLVTSFILKFSKSQNAQMHKGADLEASINKSKNMKAEGKTATIGNNIAGEFPQNIAKISFACDAGMGSSATGATKFRKSLKQAGITAMEVKHFRIEDVPKDSDVVVVHKDLAERVRLSFPELYILSINSYLVDANIKALLEHVLQSSDNESSN